MASSRWAWSAALVAGLAFLALPAGARAQKPEVEEGEKPEKGSKTKPKAPPKTETDDEKPAKSEGGSPDDAGPKIDFAAAAKTASHPEIQALYGKLAQPFDEITLLVDGLKRTKPIPTFIGDKPNPMAISYKPLEARFEGATYTAPARNIVKATPFELIAIREVDNFLKQPLRNDAGKPNARLDQFAAAEAALQGALQFHKTAGRIGEGWTGVERTVRDQLLLTQLGKLKEMCDSAQWAEANDLIAKLHKANGDSSVVQPELIRLRLSRFVKLDGKGIPDDDATAIRAALDALERKFPPSGSVPPNLSVFRGELSDKAVRFRDNGLKMFEQNKPAEGVGLLRVAAALAPELPGLKDELARRASNYAIMYVGVPKLPELFSPAAARTDTERQAVELLFDSLVQAVPDAKSGWSYRPALAAGLPKTLSLSREFRINPAAVWAGPTPAPVTANDVAATIKLYRELSQRGIRVPGDVELLNDAVVQEQDRVRIGLKQGFLDPLELMSFKVLPADQRLQGKKADDELFARQPLGSGPFTLVTQAGPGGRPTAVVTENGREQVVFRANPEYGKRANRPGEPVKPLLREIRFVISKDPVADFKSGQLHLLTGATLDDVARLTDASAGLADTAVAVSPPHRRIWMLAFNHKKPLLQSKELRRLIGHAVDRKKCLADHYRDGKDDLHKELNGPFPPDSWATLPKAPDLYNQQIALTLAAAVKAKHPSGVRLTLLCPDDTRSQEVCRKAIAAQVQSAGAGVSLDVKPLPLDQLLAEARQPGAFDLAYLPFDYSSDLYWLGPLLSPLASGGTDILGFTPSGDLETALRDVRAHTDFTEIKKRMHKLHTALVGSDGDMPFVPLWQLDQPLVIAKSLELPFPAALLDPVTVFNRVEEWRLRR